MRSRRLGIGWLKAILGCGCLFALVGALVVGAGGFWAYRAAKNTFMVDPARITQLAERESPGAKVPPGFAPKFGMDMAQLQMVIFGDSSDRSLMLMSLPFKDDTTRTHDQWIAEMEKGFSSSSKEKRGVKKMIQQNEISVECGSHKLPGVRRLVEEDGQRKWEYFVFGKSESQKEKALCVFGNAPERDKDDAFVREYAKTVVMLPIAK